MSRWFLFGLVLGLSGIVLFYVWEKVDVVRVGYKIEQLSKRKALLQREHETLQVTRSQLMAPGRIAREAREKLDMQTPEQGQIILVTSPQGEPGDPLIDGEPIRLAQGRSSQE